MMDATRTQLEAAAQRFHYRRGFDDAMAQIQRETVFDAAFDVAIVLIAFLVGWALAKRFG